MPKTITRLATFVRVDSNSFTFRSGCERGLGVINQTVDLTVFKDGSNEVDVIRTKKLSLILNSLKPGDQIFLQWKTVDSSSVWPESLFPDRLISVERKHKTS